MPGVWLTEPQQALLVAEATRMVPLETGGVLLGYRAEGDTLVIAAVVGPGPEAEHRRNSFRPDYAYQEHEIAAIYDASGRQWTYLGDWHSHPGSGASLSSTDNRTLRRISAAASARVSAPLMVVVAGGQQWEIVAYQAMRKDWRVHIARVQIIS